MDAENKLVTASEEGVEGQERNRWGRLSGATFQLQNKLVMGL